MDEIKKEYCEWKVVDYGAYGCSDYVYVTTCGMNYDISKIKKQNYCPNCGGKLK
jgi:DNA-directed RNA polymerase subunit RPC12/RpoP